MPFFSSAFSSFSSLTSALKRRKKIDSTNLSETQLKRCLSTFDLTTLGIGSTLGLGIYVLAGQVASTKAGPAIILSFAIAALTSLFAGLCYAEFGAKVPKAGSAYVYSYITVGEFMAFIIGWNLVLEYLIGTASVARGYSGYLDSLTGNHISTFFRTYMPMNVDNLSPYPDLLSFVITILLSVVLSVGVQESTQFNSIFTCLNILIVIYVIICGAFKLSFHNWSLSELEVQQFDSKTKLDKRGSGGFFPFGFSGMMSGAATCFYGFVGFDIIATTGEEAKNPKKSIPIAISFSLLIVFLAYFGVSAIQTLMWPYFDQDNDAPLPYVFESVGYNVAKWIISIGALAGLSTSLLGAMFPLPRILYAMASDGLIFRQLGIIHPKFKTPVLSTLISGFLAACLAAIFDVAQLADMMSIGTLLAYSLVAISVLILRTTENSESAVGGDNFPAIITSSTMRELFSLLTNDQKVSRPSKVTSHISILLISFSTATIFLMDLSLVLMEDNLSNFEPLAIVAVLIPAMLFVLSIILLGRQPMTSDSESFQVPLVPLIPLISVAINFYLMMKLSTPTWIRFGIWMILGLLIYGLYGIHQSTGSMSDDEKRRIQTGSAVRNGTSVDMTPAQLVIRNQVIISSD